LFFCLFFVDVLFVRFQFIYSDTTSTMTATFELRVGVDTNSSPVSAHSSFPSSAPAPSHAPAPAHATSLSPHSPQIGVESLLDNEGNVYSNVIANDVIILLLAQIIMLFGYGNEPTSAVSTYADATSAAIERMSIVEKTPTQQEQKHLTTTNQKWDSLAEFYNSNDRGVRVPDGLTECGRSITEFLNSARIEQFLLSPSSPESPESLSTCNSHIDELLEIWEVIYNDLQSPLVTHICCISIEHFLLIGEINKYVTTKIESIKNALYPRNYVNGS